MKLVLWWVHAHPITFQAFIHHFIINVSGTVAAHRSTAGHWYRYAAHSRGIDELKASRYQRCVQEPIICSPYWWHAIDVPSSRISVILRIYWRTETGMFDCSTKWKKKKGGGVVHTCRQCVPVMISPHERKLISACVRHMNTVTHWLICPLMILSKEGTSHVSPHRNGYENRHGAHCWGKTINHNPFSYTRIWMSGHHWLLVLNLN